MKSGRDKTSLFGRFTDEEMERSEVPDEHASRSILIPHSRYPHVMSQREFPLPDPSIFARQVDVISSMTPDALFAMWPADIFRLDKEIVVIAGVRFRNPCLHRINVK